MSITFGTLSVRCKAIFGSRPSCRSGCALFSSLLKRHRKWGGRNYPLTAYRLQSAGEWYLYFKFRESCRLKKLPLKMTTSSASAIREFMDMNLLLLRNPDGDFFIIFLLRTLSLFTQLGVAGERGFCLVGKWVGGFDNLKGKGRLCSILHILERIASAFLVFF